MTANLRGKSIAVLVADGFDQHELTAPMGALGAAGAETTLVGPSRGWTHPRLEGAGLPGDPLPVDLTLANAHHEDFDALLIPGGLLGIDALRRNQRAVGFVRAFLDSGRPVGATQQGLRLLFGTEPPGFACAWTGAAEVETCRGVVAARATDLPAFIEKLAEEVAEGVHDCAGA